MPQESIPSHIQSTLAHLKNPVRLVLFSRDVGCVQCPNVLELARKIRAGSPKIALEVFDFIMDRDQVELYGVQMVPALVVQDAAGRTVKFYGLVSDLFLDALADTIVACSDNREWLTDETRNTLKLLNKDVYIRVFVENTCAACAPVAETAIGFALASERIHTEIIIARDFPDLVKKNNVTSVPKVVFGVNLQIEGEIPESVFLEKIFEAEGAKPVGERRCIVCGNPTPDTICSSCKSRIQAEAVGIKLREEKIKKRQTEVRKHEKK